MSTGARRSARGVRTPRGGAAPPGVGGRRRDPARAPREGRRAGPARRRVPRGRRWRGRRPRRLGRDAGGVLRGRCVERADGRPLHRRHRAAAHRGQRQRRPGRPLRPARRWPARRSARSRSPSPAAAPTSPASPPGRAATATTTSSTAPRPSSPPASAPTSSPPPSAPAGPVTRVSACSSSRRARPASPSTARWRRWAGTAATPPSCRTSTCASPPPTWSARRAGLLPDRRPVRGRADRPRGPRLRHRGPLVGADCGVLPGARDVRQAAHRQPGGAAQARRDAPAGRGGPCLHARRRRAPRRGGVRDRRGGARQADGGRRCATYVCDQAVQLHGGTGYMHGTEVERHYRDARILPIGGGATEVLTDLAAKLLGYAS